jgi:hypothetical protein
LVIGVIVVVIKVVFANSPRLLEPGNTGELTVVFETDDESFPTARFFNLD